MQNAVFKIKKKYFFFIFFFFFINFNLFAIDKYNNIGSTDKSLYKNYEKSNKYDLNYEKSVYGFRNKKKPVKTLQTPLSELTGINSEDFYNSDDLYFDDIKFDIKEKPFLIKPGILNKFQEILKSSESKFEIIKPLQNTNLKLSKSKLIIPKKVEKSYLNKLSANKKFIYVFIILLILLSIVMFVFLRNKDVKDNLDNFDYILKGKTENYYKKLYSETKKETTDTKIEKLRKLSEELSK